MMTVGEKRHILLAFGKRSSSKVTRKLTTFNFSNAFGKKKVLKNLKTLLSGRDLLFRGAWTSDLA